MKRREEIKVKYTSITRYKNYDSTRLQKKREKKKRNKKRRKRGIKREEKEEKEN